jgi:transketolase
MCAAVNGMTLSGLRAFASGFLIFTDYARGAIRLASLMDQPVLHIWTHDSISVGEDGPTHQPIEQILSLRAIPGMIVIRPADANEMTEAYRFILGLKDRPAALICSRQALPIIDRSQFALASELARGGYILADAPGSVPDVILIGSGSEVSLCLTARNLLAAENIKVRVVSLPSWERYAGLCGVILGMRSFGMSAPMKIVAEHFGFNADHVAAAAKATMRRAAGGTRSEDDLIRS